MSFCNYDLDKIVELDNELRRVDDIISFFELADEHRDLSNGLGRNGYGIETALRCLFIQFYYDLSDRQLEKRMRYDISFRWFCSFELSEETPDHTYFCRMRKTFGTRRIGQIFQAINIKAKESGIIRGVFHFVDSSAIKVKETTWKQRDKAIKEGEEKLNNENVEKFSADKDARFGCKGNNKFWYGYKRHQCVDMGSGLIEKAAVTPANVPDQNGFKQICPEEGMVFGDKSYCLKPAQIVMRSKGCHSGAILRNNMKGKNKDKDRWLTKVRSPFEGIFSKLLRRTRYRGIAKVQLHVFFEAIVFNVKRLMVILPSPINNSA